MTPQQLSKFVETAIKPLIDKINTLEARVVKAEQKGLEFRGVHQRSNGYKRGNCVTHKGSLWIALRETDRTPGDGADWQLAVKSGRDGRDRRDAT